MSHDLSRRRFMQSAAVAAAGMAGGALVARRAGAIEPIQRDGKPKFKFSVAAYSYRDLFKPGKLTLADFIADCAAMGCDGTELTSYYFPKQVTQEYLCELKQAAFRLGLDISGTAVGNDFCNPDAKARAGQIAHVKQWVDHAAAMGAPVIRIFSGNARGGQTAEQAHKLAVAAIEEACDYAGGKGVFLALENHGGLTATAAGILALVRDVQSPWFGVNMDTGNFHSSDVYGELAQIAPYSVNVQVKVVVHPAGAGKQPSDYKRLAKILRGAAYRGYIVLEYEEAGDPRTECPQALDQIREAFA